MRRKVLCDSAKITGADDGVASHTKIESTIEECEPCDEEFEEAEDPS